MKLNRLFALLLVIAMLFSMAACSSSDSGADAAAAADADTGSDTASEAEPEADSDAALTLGVIGPMTGMLAVYGKAFSLPEIILSGLKLRSVIGNIMIFCAFDNARIPYGMHKSVEKLNSVSLLIIFSVGIKSP